MNSADNNYWGKVAIPLQRRMGLASPTRADTESDFSSAGEIPLSDSEVEAIVEYATRDVGAQSS